MKTILLIGFIALNYIVGMAQSEWTSNPVGSVFAREGGETPSGINPSICANFDADREEAIRSRLKILDYAVANSLTVIGAHVPGNGVIF
ncbi:MAG: hypothetical protein K2J82_04315 [Muribaculaceae bacterium]|nr:hypothetical protein [Muribaculaceae bacterium]MDE6753821.1 hypothetical protein [Muribaculaceae bacterium]